MSMAINIFISATNTNQGKTYTTLHMIALFSQMGYRVGVFKPIETGVDEIPLDGNKLLKKAQEYNIFLNKVSVEDIVPNRFKLPASPYVSGEVDFDAIDKSYKKIAEVSDIVLIEGAGGLAVPVKEDFLMLDFVDYFKAKLFLVVQSKLGCINDLLLNINLLKSRDFLWAINLFDESFYTISYPFLKDKFEEVPIIQKDLPTLCEKLITP